MKRSRKLQNWQKKRSKSLKSFKRSTTKTTTPRSATAYVARIRTRRSLGFSAPMRASVAVQAGIISNAADSGTFLQNSYKRSITFVCTASGREVMSRIFRRMEIRGSRRIEFIYANFKEI